MFLLLFISSVLFSITESLNPVIGVGAEIQGIVEAYEFEYKVLVVNTASNSIYMKCASADDTITGEGSVDDWWTLESGQALGWGFRMNHFGTTCFWCYWNNNGQGPRDSGNWYIHQDVWGTSGCGGPDNNEGKDEDGDGTGDGVTKWEVRDDGAYSNMCADECDNGNAFKLYSTWGPAP